MKKLVFLIIIVAIFSGCAAGGNEFMTSTSNSNSNENSSIGLPTRISEENSVTPTSTSSSNSPTLNVPTVTVNETKEPDLNTLQLCSTLPIAFNFRDELGVNYVTDLRFVNETSLAFNGWTTGQFTQSTATSESTTPSNVFELGSFSINLKVSNLDLTNGNFSTGVSGFRPLLNNPCPGECGIEIWSQSPDEQWQLIGVNTGTSEGVGVWLISQNEMIQLVSYVPPESNWQWAADSSLLWYFFYDREYGAYADAIRLSSPLSTNFFNKTEDDPMNPTTHSLAFSPQSKTLLSVNLSEGEGRGIVDNKLQMLDLVSNPPNIVSSQIIAGLISVSWNEATGNYLLQVIRENGIEFRDMSGITVVIPLKLLQTIYPSLAQGAVELRDIIPKENFAISQTGEHLAIAYPHGEIEVYSCRSD